MFYLLDLNYTLVANSRQLRGCSQFDRYQNEEYRVWLLDLLRATKPDGIFLVTIRPDSERDITLGRIAQCCGGWQPDDVFFCSVPSKSASPPIWKEYAVRELIFPKYGCDPEKYMAVESNVDTWKVYARMGIKGFKVFEESGKFDEPVRGKRSGQRRLF